MGNRKGPALVVVALLIGAAVLLWSRSRGPGEAPGPSGSSSGGDPSTLTGSGAGAPGDSGDQGEAGIAGKAATPEGADDAAQDEGLSSRGGAAAEAGGEVVLAPSSASQVPHKVLRSWGAEGASRVPGVVGMYVVVSPSIPQDDLVKLAQDLLATHRNAKVLNVRILDSSEAATHDQHLDGGAMRAKHLVAEVRRNEMQESESIRIRGVEIDPKTGGPLAEKPSAQPPGAPAGN